MLLKRISDYVLRSRLDAMLAAFICAFIPLIGGLSIVIAAFVTLRKGIYEGTLVVIAATLPILIGYWAYPGSEQEVGLSVTQVLFLMLATNGLTWMFAVWLRQYSSWSLLLQGVALLGVITVGMVHYLSPDIQAFWDKQLTSYFTHVIQNTNTDAGPMTEMELRNIIGYVKRYMTGVVFIFITFNALLQVFLARWWQAVVFNPGGLRKELCDIRMGHVIGVIFVLGLVYSYWNNDVIVDIMPILYLVFGLAGFSLLHAMIGTRKTGWIWIALMYGALIIVPIIAVMIAMLALIDTWVDFRSRLTKQT
ncbi:MAG: hypothetical protein P4M12_06680 [Gammaproteobacteria bacterium]|nr:hypothetical protein [Gammaproteobacteria bacterium]